MAVTTSSASVSCFSACMVMLAMTTWFSGRWRFASYHASRSTVCALSAFQAHPSPSRTSLAKLLMSWSSDAQKGQKGNNGAQCELAAVSLVRIWLEPRCCLNRMCGAHPVSFAFPLTFPSDVGPNRWFYFDADGIICVLVWENLLLWLNSVRNPKKRRKVDFSAYILWHYNLGNHKYKIFHQNSMGMFLFTF